MIIIPLGLGGLAFLYIFIRERLILRALEKRGVDTLAEIWECGTRNGYSYTIFAFETERAAVRKHQEIGILNRHRINRGMHLPVRYLPAQPEIARLWHEYRDSAGQATLVGVGTVLLAMAGLLFLLNRVP